MKQETAGENGTRESGRNVDTPNVLDSSDFIQPAPSGSLASNSSSLAPIDPNDKYSVFRMTSQTAERSEDDRGEMTVSREAAGDTSLGFSGWQGEDAKAGDVGVMTPQQQQQQQPHLLLQPQLTQQQQQQQHQQEKPSENQTDDDFGDFESVSFPNSVTSSSEEFGTFQQSITFPPPQDNHSPDLGNSSTILAESLQQFLLYTTPSSSHKPEIPESHFSSENPAVPSSSSADPAKGVTSVTADTVAKDASLKETSGPEEEFGTFLSSGNLSTNLVSAGGKPSLPTLQATTQQSSSNTGDKYDVFRSLEISSESSVLTEVSKEKPAEDDDFGVFAGSGLADGVPPEMEDDFGDFQCIETAAEKGVMPDSWKPSIAVSSVECSASAVSDPNTSGRQASGASTLPTTVKGFGDFEASFPSEFSNFESDGSFKSDSFGGLGKDTSFSNTEGSRSHDSPAAGSNGNFASFDSSNTASKDETSAGRQRSVSGASQALINSVPLELTQRYNLSKQVEVSLSLPPSPPPPLPLPLPLPLSRRPTTTTKKRLFLKDFDQHASTWCRCLNSCLLTLATASLAIQKIKETSLREEILRSKEGSIYFSCKSPVCGMAGGLMM